MKSRSFSPAQMAYMEARAFFDAAYQAGRDYDKLIDLECDKLGIETPYGILPEGHPMLAHAQALLDRENVARKLMYAAAHNLFDWATETTLAKKGTLKQVTEVRAMVAEIKKKAHVEKFFIDLVDLSLRLDVAAVNKILIAKKPGYCYTCRERIPLDHPYKKDGAGHKQCGKCHRIADGKSQ